MRTYRPLTLLIIALLFLSPAHRDASATAGRPAAARR